MEATALSVGKSVLNGALGYAKSAFAEEVALQLGIQKDHTFVADELEMMRSFMMEAHEEQDNSKVVKTWVKQVRDTAYDVEDSLQDFAVHLKRPSWWRFPRTLLERHRVAKQMKELRNKVEDVSQRNVRYHLIKGSAKATINSAEQSSVIATAIFGIDDARRAAKQDNQRVDLVQLINSEDQDLKVIAVWGTSGDMGQTTIIRMAYENPDVQIRFPCRAWVRVMHPFSPRDFVQSLVNQLHATQGVEALLEKEKTEQDLAKKFNGCVNDRKCLIVLNDLSTIEEWDQIKKCFQKCRKGSRIIVSSTQVEVASLCAGQESQASELKQLSADQTLYAFYDKGSQIIEDSVKPVSISDVAITSTNNHTVAHGEIIDDQSMDADEKKVARKSLTRIRTSVGASEESQLIGREKEISEITHLILNNDSQQVQVISVWGMGGLGKTTLVSGVYQSPRLSDKFDKYVFVTIMRPFILVELLRSLAEQLHKGSSKKEELLENRVSSKKSLASMEVTELTGQLKRLLEKKSCLIVLDDFSDTSEWDQIKPTLFPLLEKTSRIIVTTRKENIANHCSGKNGNVHNLKVLKHNDALCLLSEKVFEEATYLDDQNNLELVKEAKQILKKCDGLPLAIVVIGGFLANRPKTPEEWRKLNENINAELEMNPELGMIRTVLEKSYDGLPYHLKSCFLYLSIFPEDQIISRRRLVHRWAAEGYSTAAHGKSAIEIANGYFMELKNRSMILPSQQSAHSRKSIDSCKVHDLIRDIAISKSTEENLVFRVEEGCSAYIHGAIRHLAISSNWKGDKSEFEGIVDLSRIRSLSLFGDWKPFFVYGKMRFIRVLDFEGTRGLKYHHLDQIWKLIHLKFLSLRGCIDIDLLPDLLGNLRQLQMLDIRGTYVKALPKTIIKLKKLQYIHIGSRKDHVWEEKDSLMKRCRKVGCICATCCLPLLCEIYGPLHKALARRDAWTFACCVKFPSIMMGVHQEEGAMVPSGIRKLKDLHTLRNVNVGRGNAILRDIGMLTGLHKLGVAGINKKNGRAFRLAISNLGKLESLSVSSAGMSGLCGCLDDISSPPENLQSLKLYGNLKTLPEWIKELQHLVKLKLVGARLLEHDVAMEFLGKLPKLEILVISAFRGKEFHFKSPQTGITAFGSLRVLKLAELWNIKSVKFDEGTMLKLERLQVEGRIENEIGFSGLEFLQNINEVQLSVYFPWDYDRIRAARARARADYETVWAEEEQEARRKGGELKRKIREQLARNPNQPIIT
uniref:Pib variant protein n=1 Tax=Oryza sativa TaxID=4530 RepID=A0A1R7T0Y3_ORYSA|nr:Pib variant protein [Oryza sativa]ANA57425.1 Pib variant protein [Oryza sativa]